MAESLNGFATVIAHYPIRNTGIAQRGATKRQTVRDGGTQSHRSSPSTQQPTDSGVTDRNE